MYQPLKPVGQNPHLVGAKDKVAAAPMRPAPSAAPPRGIVRPRLRRPGSAVAGEGGVSPQKNAIAGILGRKA